MTGEYFFWDPKNIKAFALQQGHTGFYKTSQDGNPNSDIKGSINRGCSASRKHYHMRNIYSRPTVWPSFVPSDILTLYRGSEIWIGWLICALRPFETVFQSISGRLPERGSMKREMIDKR